MEHPRNIQLEILQNESKQYAVDKKSFTVRCNNCGKRIVVDSSYTFNMESNIDLYATGDNSVYIYCGCGNSITY